MELRLLEIDEHAGTMLEARRPGALADRCQHVAVDGRLTTLGYRFYPMPSGDVPSFFCKRFSVGDRTGAITLLAGIDARTGDAILDDCRSAREAARLIARSHAGWWVIRLSFGARMLTFPELEGSFAEREPAAHAAFLAELDALGARANDACPICSMV
jgi:hypothetical protein